SETATAGGQLLTFYKHLFWTRMLSFSPRRASRGNAGRTGNSLSPGGATSGKTGFDAAPPGLGTYFPERVDPRLARRGLKDIAAPRLGTSRRP
ncbi:MAG: hypothetical protein ACLQVG_11780, partial [Terriglobia bacterium]